jgi:hypothetical protein
LLVLVIAGFAVRFQTEKQKQAPPKVRLINVSPIVVRPVVNAPPHVSAYPAPVAAIPAENAAEVTRNADAAVALPAIESGDDAAAATTEPAATETSTQTQPDESGLTREELARNFPRLSERFDFIDTDRDGRISAVELTVAMSQQARNRP